MSAWRHAAVLALRYLAAAPGRTAALVLATAVAVFLPLFGALATRSADHALMARAQATPVLLGHVGDEVDLTLALLYFRGKVRDRVPYATRKRADPDRNLAVPLHTGHTVGGTPIVGTSRDYYAVRGLQVAQGRLPAVLGEVVAGAAAADRARLRVGDKVQNDVVNLFDLAGAAPVLLEVVGVLAPVGSPDDRAFFTDVKTTWVLDGALHGHAAVGEAEALQAEDGEDGEDGNVEASAAVFMLAELTPETRAAFHFHGEAEALPVTGIAVFPADARAHDQLLGDLLADTTVQAVRPTVVVRDVLAIIGQAHRVFDAVAVVFGAATLVLLGVVASLTLRLRRDELALMQRIGCAPGTIPRMVAVEWILVVGLAVAVAVALAVVGAWGLQGLLEAG